MSVKELISQGETLLGEKKYIEAIDKFNEALESITNETQYIQEQIDAQFWLGRCYFEQALKASDVQAAKSLFDKAIEHHTKQLELTEHLTDEQKSIEEKVYAQSWLGSCYFEQAIKISDTQTAKSLFDEAIDHHTKEFELAKQLANKQESLEAQVYAQASLGRCCLEQAIKTFDEETAASLFKEAIEHNKERLKLATQLTDERKSIEKQVYAQHWLGRCHLEQALKTLDEKDADPLFKKAIKHHTKQLKLSAQLTDNQKSEAQNNARYWLGCCNFDRAIKISDEKTSEKLFKKAIKHKVKYTNQILFLSSPKKYQKSIAKILASLSIFRYEARNTIFAHYTNPNVTELLFGLAGSSPNAMRMNSATYMNDPYEGKSLLEFLGIPEASLENITEFPKYNAFFSCFSRRVNDLNQFRLYGKEDSVEASGCCLVFNKNRNWLQQTDIAKSFSSMKNEAEIERLTSSSEKNYSLYQIAYIAYLDEYIDRNKCEIITKSSDEKFAIYLPKVGNSDEWHSIRVKKLKEALKDLRKEISKPDNEKYKQDLEYIRYLFKDFAFRDEEEFRLLKIAEIGKETEYCDKTNSVFVPYADISNMVDEVILGTNYEKTNQKRKVEAFRHHMKKNHPNVKITHSSLPINANPPIKKD